MTDADLKKKLSALRVPPLPADPAVRERALHRSLVALAQPQPAAAPVRTFTGLWRGALIALTVGLVAGVLVFRGRDQGAVAVEVTNADALTLAQMQELFPGQLNAVIERDGAVQLDLSAGQAPGTMNGQPVVVQLEGGGHRLRVLSYSGRSITLELKGAHLTFEALVTGDGGVVLSGVDFVWSSAHPGRVAGYRIDARPLNTAL